MAHGVTWFEIACSDFDRAKRFYETIFGVTLQDMKVPGQKMAPHTDTLLGDPQQLAAA